MAFIEKVYCVNCSVRKMQTEKCMVQSRSITAGVCIYGRSLLGCRGLIWLDLAEIKAFFLLTAFQASELVTNCSALFILLLWKKREMYLSCLRQTVNEHYPGSSTALREHPIKINLKGTAVIHTVTFFWQGTRLNCVSSKYKLTPLLSLSTVLKCQNKKKKKSDIESMWTSVEDKICPY